MGHPLPASHQGQCHQKDRGVTGGSAYPPIDFTAFFHLFRVVKGFKFRISFCWALTVFFSPGLSNPQVLRHLGNFLCFRGNPIRILLTLGNLIKTQFTLARQRSEVMNWKLASFQKSRLWQDVCVTKELGIWTFHETKCWSDDLEKFYIYNLIIK